MTWMRNSLFSVGFIGFCAEFALFGTFMMFRYLN
jgi:hypothetical protein